MSKLRIAIADDHTVLRSGLKMLLESQEDMEVVGEASDAMSAMRVLRDTQPDVMTLDLSMPGSNGFSLMRELKQQSPKTKLVVLTMHEDLGYLQAAVRAGADGYVLKKAADDELMAAIRSSMAGQFHSTLSANALDMSESGFSESNASKPLIEQLSEREHEVLIRVAQGLTNQEIADRLVLSVKTVESYRARLMHKLGLRSRADLVSLALKLGLLRADPELPHEETNLRGQG